MQDVRSNKPFYSCFCKEYQSEAQFFVRTHPMGARSLVVIYEAGGFGFAAGIPQHWTDERLLELILWPMKDIDACYPAWEMPARAFGSAAATNHQLTVAAHNGSRPAYSLSRHRCSKNVVYRPQRTVQRGFCFL